jgi:hypothetical protein
MVRITLLLCAAIVAAASFACTQQQQQQPQRSSQAVCPDGSLFLDRVKLVQSGYAPAPDPMVSPTPPQNITEAPVDENSPYAPALESAFRLAPQAFQNTLCDPRLRRIYVNGPMTCSRFIDCEHNSWGYRSYTDYTTYVAISAGLWKLPCPGHTSYVYHCFETDLLNGLLGYNNPLNPQLAFANSEADNFDMTILAALAHEIGHARWYQVMSPDGPAFNKNKQPNYDPNGFCGGAFFYDSWGGPVGAPPPWREFGQISPDLHRAQPQDAIALIRRNLETYRQHHEERILAVTANTLDKLYQAKSPWASYFASISPDEDFVETYKLYILTNAQDGIITNEGPLRSLKFELNIGSNPPYNENIPLDYVYGRKQILSQKMHCIANVIDSTKPM